MRFLRKNRKMNEIERKIRVSGHLRQPLYFRNRKKKDKTYTLR
jgi:hypothetical protein